MTTYTVGAQRGSSPLTRGKPMFAGWAKDGDGLIPAHAGKTEQKRASARAQAAHPRSRGENPVVGRSASSVGGSSPLTRGKRTRHAHARPLSGLIPAHAGKTSARRPRRSGLRAHPRSRGENSRTAAIAASTWGSSPLTRGKRTSNILTGPNSRLIPAHAGKTLPDLRFYRADRSDLGKP